MSVPIVALFNNKGGVGKTTLAYHLAWKLSDMGMRVLACDLDPQANFTAAFLSDTELEDVWEGGGSTIYRSLVPLIEGSGDLADPVPMRCSPNLHLLPGDLDLSRFEDELSRNWPECLDRKVRPFKVISGFWRVIQRAAESTNSNMALVDLGPTLGAINRAALVASDYLVIPVAPDLFSLRGLMNLGPAVRRWRTEWAERLSRKPDDITFALPDGKMHPLGYVVLQHAVRLDRPVEAYSKWMKRIPEVYLESVQENQPSVETAELAQLRHYRSLMALAQEARKPVFHLKPSDGAIGAHSQAAKEIGKDFEKLARIILQRAQIPLPIEAGPTASDSQP